jgi:hypothetical protein
MRAQAHARITMVYLYICIYMCICLVQELPVSAYAALSRLFLTLTSQEPGWPQQYPVLGLAGIVLRPSLYPFLLLGFLLCCWCCCYTLDGGVLGVFFFCPTGHLRGPLYNLTLLYLTLAIGHLQQTIRVSGLLSPENYMYSFHVYPI